MKDCINEKVLALIIIIGAIIAIIMAFWRFFS